MKHNVNFSVDIRHILIKFCMSSTLIKYHNLLIRTDKTRKTINKVVNNKLINKHSTFDKISLKITSVFHKNVLRASHDGKIAG